MSQHDTLTLRDALRNIQYEAASLADAQVIALQALNATYPARAALSATQPAAGADVLLDALRDNSWDLVSFDRPTGGDDADIGWRVIEHHMEAPTYRRIAEVFEDDPSAAIRAAIAASGRKS